MSKSSLGKSLKGINILPSNLVQSITSNITNVPISNSVLTNVTITSGTIDGVVIGSSQSGPIYSTTFQSGVPGTGYNCCFYGSILGDSACWIANIGLWNIQGDLLVRDIANIANFQIAGNNIIATNSNGNINLQANGSGIVSVGSAIQQTASSGNISFQTSNGGYSVNVSGSSSMTSGNSTTISTSNGDINLTTGLFISSLSISNISTGLTPTITTTVSHKLSTGDYISISGTNCSPNVNGIYTVVSTPLSNTFTISPGFSVTSSGNTGTVVRQNNISLTATNNIFIPDNVPINFNNSSRKIYSDGTNIRINSGTGNITLDSSVIINGTNTTINSNTVSIVDNIPYIGSTLFDGQNRGIAFNYNNGSSVKTAFIGRNAGGCFTYIADATISSNIVSGFPSCVSFGSISGTSLDLAGGNMTNIGTINSCNVNCSGLLTLTGGTGITLSSPTSTLSGNLVVNGGISNINSGTINLVANIPNVGNTTNDSQNRGISFNYNTGTLVKTAFIGRNSGGCFTYIADATISGNIVSGTPSCVSFGSISGTSLDLAGGNMTNIGTINSCNINCSGTLTLTGGTGITLSSPTSTLSGNLVVNGSSATITPNIPNVGNTTNDSQNRGISFNYNTGSSVKTAFIGRNAAGCFTYIADATISGNIVSGTPSCVSFGSISGTSLDLAGGNMTNIGTINSCNINCSGLLTLTGGTGITLSSPTSTLSGNLVVNGGISNINSGTINLAANIPNVGNTTNDSQNRGISFNYNTGTLVKTAFIGRNSGGCFTYIADATITNNVVTGTPSCVAFGSISGTSLDLAGGNMTNIGTINSCNINCSGTLTLTGGTGITLSSPTSTLSGNLVVNGSSATITPNIPNVGNTTNDSQNRGISFNYNTGSSIKKAFIGRNAAGCFTYIADATITNNVVTGTPSCATFGDITATSINLSTGNVNYSTEHISGSGGSSGVNPSATTTVTFVTTIGIGNVTGTLQPGTSDGQIKQILMENLASTANYILSCPNGRMIDPGSGSSNTKNITFSSNGQGISLIWSTNVNSWILTNGGGCMA